jgi:hypothetical protein
LRDNQLTGQCHFIFDQSTTSFMTLFWLVFCRANSFGHRQIDEVRNSFSLGQQPDWLVFLWFHPVTLKQKCPVA